MKIKETKLKGCFVIEPQVFYDDRGYFYESFHQKKFEQVIGEAINFVQDNQSFSRKGVLRGIHFQKGEYAQAKLVRVLQGKVLDVVVDLRKDSETFGQYETIELSADNKKQLFVPRGFGHGFITLSETSEFAYKCDAPYHKESEGGIVFNDKTLKINWKFPKSEIIVSEKDKELPPLEEPF
ncbi:dTDP-4-dehydrorhamnose 3,5-epimerase [Galbibacter sp. PAP.153]|uniref:dTDP-4-dehydrorhamnose 3,5-epimerase n=1 Tax=Galbibacter sp. PAP.153 TaxID=3104623 RepID=UPI00300AAF4C